MATTSEVKAGMDDISSAIRAARQALVGAKARVSAAKTDLSALPTTFADVVAEINGYPSDGTAFEQLAKAELAAMTAEFQDLQTKATTAETALAAIDFTTEG